MRDKGFALNKLALALIVAARSHIEHVDGVGHVLSGWRALWPDRHDPAQGARRL